MWNQILEWLGLVPMGDLVDKQIEAHQEAEDLKRQLNILRADYDSLERKHQRLLAACDHVIYARNKPEGFVVLTDKIKRLESTVNEIAPVKYNYRYTLETTLCR